MSVTKCYVIRGKVQRVMFRQTIIRAAIKRKLKAGATNTKERNKVYVTLQGKKETVDSLVKLLSKGEKLNSWGAKVKTIKEKKKMVSMDDHQVTTANVDNFNWNPKLKKLVGNCNTYKLEMSYVFSNPGFISVGDPYKDTKRSESKKAKKKSLSGKKQFVTNPTKKGRVGKGVLFSDYDYKSEKYKDAKEGGKKKKKKNVFAVPFKFTSPSPKQSGSGSYFGCIGGKFEHMQENDVVKKGEVRQKVIPKSKPNIVTNPPKKGTYGYVGTTLQKDLYRRENSEPYKDKVSDEKKEKKKKGEKKILIPFRSSSKSAPLFDPYKNLYAIPEDIMKKKREDAKKPKEIKKEKRAFVPWKPSQPKHEMIGKHPEYLVDPYDKRDNLKKKDDKPRPIFRPTATAKSGPSRSIIFSKFTK